MTTTEGHRTTTRPTLAAFRPVEAADAEFAGAQRFPRWAMVQAALVPVMVLTGFAMLAIVPLGLLVRTTLHNRQIRSARPWVTILVATYATPLLLWAILPDRAPSLTKDMHPAFVPVITVAGVLVLAVLTRTWLASRRTAAPRD